MEFGIKSALGMNYFDETNGEEFLLLARQQALQWILFEDPLQLNSSQRQHLVQRFVLVLFHFQTTRFSPWTECSMSLDGQGSSYCNYHFGADSSWGIRWLSDSHECHWAGVVCTTSTGERVVTLHIGKHPSKIASR